MKLSEFSCHLDVAIIVDSFFPAAALVGEVDVLPQSQGNFCVVILHLGLIS